MRGWTPIILFLLATVAVVASLITDNSFGKLAALRQNLFLQHDKNKETQKSVQDLREEVVGLQRDPRVLEKAARNELGMARPNEYLFIFDKQQNEAESSK